MAEHEYKRLTWGRAQSAFNIVRSSLWIGKDHLLIVESIGYSETYKRFYFRDIQAVILVRTNRQKLWNGILGTCAALPLLIWGLFAVTDKDAGGWIVALIFSLGFSIPLLLNILRGPTCACQLRTAVNVEDLPSLNRFRRASKVMNRLRPLIAEAQGVLAPADIPSRLRELLRPPSTGTIEPALAGDSTLQATPAVASEAASAPTPEVAPNPGTGTPPEQAP
jgi:hypothetical protein